MPDHNSPDAAILLGPAVGSSLELTGGRRTRWFGFVLVIYALAGLGFYLDLGRDNDLAFGIIYTPLIATAVIHRRRSGVWILTVVASLMVIIGAFFPVMNSDLPDMIGNRVLSILAIIATAAFVQHARNVQEQLAAATRRAEAAERIKGEVLSDLSEEIRTPLHTMLGLLTLTMAQSQPAQREALGRVRTDGKLLLATIDNLIDLTRIGERTLKRQRVDIASIARDAAEGARPAAKERQISIAVNTEREDGPASAMGDSWAMRRILDNLLANAVRFTPPGGEVSVSVDRGADTVTTSISDTGSGFRPGLGFESNAGVLESDHSPLSESGGAGLALSSRLARAMKGRLTAENGPDAGATVRLSLPAADREAV